MKKILYSKIITKLKTNIQSHPKSNTPWRCVNTGNTLFPDRSQQEQRADRRNKRNTFNLGDVCIVLALTAHIFDPGGDVLEALSTIFRVPLGRRSIVQAQMMLRATALLVRQTLFGWKSRERRDRAGFTSIIRSTVTMTLISRVLEGVFLARCSARFREWTSLLRARHTAADLFHALSYRDLLKFYHLRTVQFTFFHQSFEALLERRIAGSGGWSRRRSRRGSGIRRRSKLSGISSSLFILEQLDEEIDPIAETASTWRARAARATPAAGWTRALRWCMWHDSSPR